MSYTPFAHAENLRIGTVDRIAHDRLQVLLDNEAPESVALNAGGVHPFPRVNGYILTPVNDCYLVGQIESMTAEQSAFPKRQGKADSGLIDLPYPLRKMSANPIGTLWKKDDAGYTFRRGADALPSVGAPVLLPTEAQLHSIIKSGDNLRVHIGTSPLVANADVHVDPDRLFGRHLAVLGNTGSGKSCSVAGLIRWSLEAAKKKCDADSVPHARFIVLDPNGEYSKTFSESDIGVDVKIFAADHRGEASPLKVPLWFWNSEEWSSFTHASEGTQRPLLKRALREIKASKKSILASSKAEKEALLQRTLSSILISILHSIEDRSIRDGKFGFVLEADLKDITNIHDNTSVPLFDEIQSAIGSALKENRRLYDNDEKQAYFRAFAATQINPIVEVLEKSLDELGGVIYQDGPDEDVPLPFKGAALADHLQVLAKQEKATQYVDPFISRIRTFLSDSRIAPIIDGCNDPGFLKEWLDMYLGGQVESRGQITILDLSLVPTEIIHVIMAVISRMIFSALQRYRKLNDAILPTVLVVEEAHTFVSRYTNDAESQNTARVCCQAFERIAREGRKHGLGLVLSSQRPSELSPTVLSQCNTFLLHRISNERDQDLVGKLLPDSLRGLLRDLPLLPSQHAILLGWASELPVLVKMKDLPENQRPRSDDPDYWNVWTNSGPGVRDVDWQAIANHWQGKNSLPADDGSETDKKYWK